MLGKYITLSNILSSSNINIVKHWHAIVICHNLNIFLIDCCYLLYVEKNNFLCSNIYFLEQPFFTVLSFQFNLWCLQSTFVEIYVCIVSNFKIEYWLICFLQHSNCNNNFLERRKLFWEFFCVLCVCECMCHKQIYVLTKIELFCCIHRENEWMREGQGI